MIPYLRRFKGSVRRSEAEQVALAVRILDGMHWSDVYARAIAELGARGNELGPLDLTRNTLRAYVNRLNKAHQPPPLVSGLSAELAVLIGDYSASTMIERYATADGRPMPSTQIKASHDVYRYRWGAGYAGLLCQWSKRSGSFALSVLSPDDLGLEYATDDPTEPTIIRHRGIRTVDGESVEVQEVYDLTDYEAPGYFVMAAGEDITEKVHGRTFTGDDYFWRDSAGAPFHPIVIAGDNRHPYRTDGLIEATLKVSVLWTHWGAGIRDAGHPQRNVRGLVVAGLDSDSDTGQTGVSTGPETVIQWADTDPDRPGSHWQDNPGFNPEIVGSAIRSYELSCMASLGLPVDYERTGGEPTEQERKAVEALIATTLAEIRRFDSEVIRRCASIANAMKMGPFDETAPGILYRDEVTTALDAAVPTDETTPEAQAPATPGEGPTDDDDTDGS